MVNIGQVVVGIIILLVVVGGLLYIFYSRSNAVEKTGYGALIMLALISMMIPIFWIAEGGQEASAQSSQFELGVQRGLALYAQYCTNNCYQISKDGKLLNPTYNGYTIDQLNQLSDEQLMRIIAAGIYAPGVTPPPVRSLVDDTAYGGPLSTMDEQYLFDFLRSADPGYLKSNGYPLHNGFDDLVSYLQNNDTTAYNAALAAGSPTDFGTPVNMSNQKSVTIEILNSAPGQTCDPACFQYKNVEVKVGTTITWINKSSTPHTVTAAQGESASVETPASGSFDSSNGTLTKLLQPGQSYTYTITQADYNLNSNHEIMYYCKIHPMMVAALTIVQ